MQPSKSIFFASALYIIVVKLKLKVFSIIIECLQFFYFFFLHYSIAISEALRGLCWGARAKKWEMRESRKDHEITHESQGHGKISTTPTAQ